MAPSPTPAAASNRERARDTRTLSATSAGPEGRGTRTRKKNGTYGDDESDTNYGVGDDSFDGWRAWSYPAATSSSQNRRRIHWPLAQRARSVGRENTFGRGRSPPPVAVYSDGDNEKNEGFSRGGRVKRASPSVDTRRRARVDGRSSGEQSRRQLGNRRPSSRSPGRAAGDDTVSAAGRGRERGRSVDGGAPRQGKAGKSCSSRELWYGRRGGSARRPDVPIYSQMEGSRTSAVLSAKRLVDGPNRRELPESQRF